MSRCDPILSTKILGMCDSISLLLGARGYNALKLVPYGDFEEVLPWLLRLNPMACLYC